MSIRGSIILFLLFTISFAQQVIELNSLKGGDVNNLINVTLPFAVYVSAQDDDFQLLQNIFLKTLDNQIISINALKNKKPKQGSGLLQAFPVNSTAYLSTSLSDEQISSLNGFIYITTAKQLADSSFFVYDVDQYQKVQIDRVFIGSSTIVFLNSNRQSSPIQSSTITGWLQSSDSTVNIYKGFPTDQQETPSSQIFSNPVQTTKAKNDLVFMPKVEKFSLSLRMFYFKNYLDITFYIEPTYFDIDNSATSAYSTTGFIHKPVNQIEKKRTVLCVRDVNYNGTTGANLIGNGLFNDSKVIVQENDYPQSSSIKLTPVSQILAWSTFQIGQNITISSEKMDGGEYFVQYYILRDQRISGFENTTPSTTSVETTTSSSSGPKILMFATMMIARLI